MEFDSPQDLVTTLEQSSQDPTTTMELDSPTSRKTISSEELVRQVLRMADNRSRAELIVLELMAEFSFSFEEFKQLLRGKLSIHLWFFILPLIRCRASRQ